MSEHMRGHRAVDAGFVGNALQDALNRAGRHANGVMDGKVAVDQWAYPNLQPSLRHPINWNLIAPEYDNMIKYSTALRLDTADTDAILRRFTRHNS
jgi:TnpA family transposase